MSDSFGVEYLVADRHDMPVGTVATPHQYRANREGLSVSLQSGLRLRTRAGRPVAPDGGVGRQMQLLAKRLLLDVPLAAGAMLALLPLLLTVALAIRLTSKGPALFSQIRVGRNGEVFRMLKFRTMRTETCDATGLSQVVANDDRVTPVGRFLRATSLDELPQLWNVLVGDMSVIGPRPMVPGMRAGNVDYREAVPYYDYRHLVRPGLSGWAQANGLRGSTRDAAAAKVRIDHDCAYVQNVSVALDIRIICRTLVREFLTGSGV